MNRSGKPLFKNRTLQAKAARTWLIAHPGSTNDEILAGSGASIAGVQRMGLAFWRRDADGTVRWFPKAGIAYAHHGQKP